MDSGGTWDGSVEVTDTTGDRFALVIRNTAGGLPANDTAFDLAVSVAVPPGIRLPHEPFAVAVAETPAGRGCPPIAGVTATQPGAPGTTIDLAIPVDTDIPPGCGYIFELGLTTVDRAPFAAAGSYRVDFSVGYNELDNDSDSRRTAPARQDIEVRGGAVALLKTALTPLAGDSDLVEFTVSVLGAGRGGVFDVELTDVLSTDLTGLTLAAPPSPPGRPGPGPNQYTFDYIAPGERVDVTVQALVAVDPAAASCPDLRNDAAVIDRSGDTGSGFDSIPYDLQHPFLSYTAQAIGIPFGAAGADITVPVRNTGTGVAKNISLTVANLAPFVIVVDNLRSPRWSYAGGGVFVHNGTLAPGASDDLAFNISAASCPSPAAASLKWVPKYQNACGTEFYPPLGFSSVSVSDIPSLGIGKTVSSPALNIGHAGSYTLALSGVNVAALPDDGVPDNRDFVVTDTLPTGITGAVINSIPATTEVLVNGAPYTAGAVIPDNAVVTWRGDRDDLLPLPTLPIDFTAGATGVCPVGQSINNTAALSYGGCAINNASNSASFILSENPTGGAMINVAVGGDGRFQAGARDMDGIAGNELREGGHIPFTASYSFPAGFTGVWGGTSFQAELRSSAGSGRPLVLTNNANDVHVEVTRISDGALVCSADLNPAAGDLTGGDGTAALVIPDLGALSVCALPANMADHDLVISYSATSPEGNLDGNGDPIDSANIGSYIENTTLSVNSGPLGCLGTRDHVQGASVDIVRADATLSLAINNGNPVEVCSVVPVALGLRGPAAGTAGDNLLLQFNDANYEFVDAAGNPGDPAADIAYGGALAALGLDASRSGNDILLRSVPITTDFSGDGTATFNMRLRDTAVATTLTARVDYDSHHTSPDGGATDADRDYSASATATTPHVLAGQLEMEFLPPDIILRDQTRYVFRAQVTNVGTGAAVNAKYRITFPAGFAPVNGGATSPLATTVSDAGQTFEWALGDMAAGSSINIDIEAHIDQTTCFQGPGELIVSQNEWGCGSPIINTANNPGIVLPPAQLQLTHDPNRSFCELCNEGEIRLLVSNSGGVLLTDVDVTEDLRASGLTYVPGSTTYSVDGAAPVAGGDPTIGGASHALLNWTAAQLPELANLYSAFNAGAGRPQAVEIRFRVRRNAADGFDEEGLIAADRRIEARAGFGLFCGPPPQSASSGLFELPIEQPVPQVVLQGRNVDASQPASAYGATVYGGTNDDVIWRVNVRNSGALSLADLEDLVISDAIGGNFDIEWICDTEANATLAAGGASPGPPACITAGAGTVTSVSDFAIDDPFGNPGNDERASFVDVLQGSGAYVYFIGRVQNTCTNHANNAGIAWGCEADSPPDGGITLPAANAGIRPPFSNTARADLSAAVNPAGLAIGQTVTGANAAQPVGSKGVVTVTIANNTGGVVRNLRVRDVLPAGYALDTTRMSAAVTPAYAAYAGMIDTITLANPQADLQDNVQPLFDLTSSTGAAPQDHLLRHGDVLTITLGMVRVAGFDLAADPVVRTENTGDGTDPIVNATRSNQVFVDFEDTCGTAYRPTRYPLVDDAVAVAPEDLDIDINPADPDLIYILSDPVATLDLTVTLTNNGGHDATDYHALVTAGSGLNVVTVPAGCAVTSNPPPRAVWIPPLPPAATVYHCTGNDPLAPGRTDSFAFQVQKQGAGADLTFRADVVGEITLSDGTPLGFPPPDSATINNTANNYSLDSIRARLIGFNLTKVAHGDCSEDNPPPVANANVQIGEDCGYRIEAGWFGFATPGFGGIQIRNVAVTDAIPDGQGFIVQDTGNSSAGIINVTTTPAPLNPLDKTALTWSFDPFASDETFVADVTTRTLNDPLDRSAAPNRHAAVRSNTVDATFEVDFGGAVTAFGPATPGYPPAALRTVNVTVTEPRLTISKAVCNETLYGVGPACGNFAALVNDGDSNDSFVYRVIVRNQASSAGVPRAPAYDVTLTDTFDASDLLILAGDFDTDGLDNDGDGLIDEGGEATVTDNVAGNGVPAVVTVSHTGSAALQRIDPGAAVTLYYRVDPDNAVAPGQRLINTTTGSYDSLAGASGNQQAPQRPNGDPGGARVYAIPAAGAAIEITALAAPPDSKAVLNLSHTPLGGAAPFVGPQDVVIGEELEYRLRVLIPIAHLSNFVIRDELPAGIRCIEAPVVDLDAGVYAGVFTPGGRITPTCTGGLVEWDFGDQRLTAGPTFDFVVSFLARVENSASTNDGDVLRNGGTGAGSTRAAVTYRDAGGNPVAIALGPTDVTVREPHIALAKSYNVATADADDVLTVTVTATNDGSAPAYRLQILDDLVTVPTLTYLGNISGTDPPDDVDTVTLGAARPIFSWAPANPVYPIAPGATVSFSFQVRVAGGAQPLEVLDNTVQARWTSLSDRSRALNATSLIGPDGALTGMRTGTLPAAGDPVNDYESSARNAALSVPGLAMTKIDLDPAVVPTIGARKHFRIEIALPEGVTHGLLIDDRLDVSGTSYVLEDSAPFDIAYTFQGIASINGQPPAATALIALPAHGGTGSAVWDVGSVVTQSEDDLSTAAIDPVIRIDYYARIANDLATDAGDALQNSARMDYVNGETAATESAASSPGAITVVEPVLTAGKAFSNVTPGKLAGDLPDAGDTIEYRITAANGGASAAFDVNVVDTLPAGLRLDAGFTPSATIDGVPVAGFTAIPAGAPAGPLVWGRGNGDDALDIPAGRSLVLTYRATVADTVEPNQALANGVLLDWTSLDGAHAAERTGAGCPASTAPDDYCAGPALAALAVSDANAIVKAVTGDGYADPNDATLRIGDTVSYRLELAIQEGVTRDIVVQDTLPAGMAFVDVLVINGDDGADGTYTPPAAGAGSNFAYAPMTTGPASVPQAGQTGTLTWTIGTVANDPQGDAASDTLVIEYRARVLPGAGIPQVASTVLRNTARLGYVDVNGAPPTPHARLGSGADITVLQPVIDTLAKIDRTGRPSGVRIDPATDVMSYRLSACNAAGGAPAYGLLIEDTLPLQHAQGGITGPVNGAGRPDVYIAGVLATEGAGNDYLYTAPAGRGGVLRFSFATPLDPGACVDIDFDIGFYTDFGVGQVWDNRVQVLEYHSLPAVGAEAYAPVGPVLFNMHNVAPIHPPVKTLASPASGEATIGEEVVYRIVVPGAAMNGALHDIAITDTLDPSLSFVGATDVSGNGFAISDATLLPNRVELGIDQIPAGRQAVIELRARVANLAAAAAGLSFDNTVAYRFATRPGGLQIDGGSATTATPLRLVEPSLTLAKAVANLTRPGSPPDAGDVLRYTLTLTAAGGGAGDDYSDAFDVAITDDLGLGLAYRGNAGVTGAGNTIAAPVVTGDGIATAQRLRWGLADGNADIDVGEGTAVAVSYEVVVLDGALPVQALGNSATVRWTSRDGPAVDERDGSGRPAHNDYIAGPATTTVTTPDANAIAKRRITDSWGAADANVRVGDIVEYELRLTLQEGTSPHMVVTDTLPRGLAFAGIAAVNGDTTAPFAAVAPFGHADIAPAGAVVAGDARSGATTVTWDLGAIVNAGDNAANDEFVIVYRARVLDGAHPQLNAIALHNTAQLDYGTAAGASSTKTASDTITLWQPMLTVSKTAAPAGGDTILQAGELVTYTVEIANAGAAPAYDTVLHDVLPVGMRHGAATVTMVSTELLAAGTILPNVAPGYDAASGVATWDFDSGVADQYTIPAGDTLRLVYRVQADAGLGAGLDLVNRAQVERYYSFDDDGVPVLGSVGGVREIYGPSNSAAVTLTTPLPNALDKRNPVPPTAAIGEPFSYRITVPDAPQGTALHDVRIIDDLTAAAAELVYVGVARVAGSQAWAPVNTGTPNQLVIEDVANGIDIPAGEQVVIDVTVMLRDSPGNVSGLTFTNSASYTFNQVNDDDATRAAGGAGATGAMTVVEPELTLHKSGPPTMRFAVPQTFTLDIQNVGTGPAWDVTVTDRLPDPAAGGLCDTAPANVAAQLFLADGTTPLGAPLVAGTDFVSAFGAAPVCTLTVTLQTAAGRIDPTHRLIVSYQAALDRDNANGVTLTNVAGATRWFSADTAGAGASGETRTYGRTVTDGTVGVLDHEDAHTVAVEAPALTIEKTVVNVTSGQNPGLNAEPGDTLRYAVLIRNAGPVAVPDFALRDELDRLTDPAVFALGSLRIVTVPAAADTANTAPAGGARGTGLLEVRNLALSAAGGPNDRLVIEFEATLRTVLDSGSAALNQALVDAPGFSPLPSDDPLLPGAADPTQTLIGSLPVFRVAKTSQDLSGDPAVLQAGDTLRYTITVKNIGLENARGAVLRDQVPANTRYVADSTRLNGSPVGVPDNGVPPLQDGILIHAPEDATAGYMRADPAAAADNVATVSFDVVVDGGLVNGTVISNQAFVSARGVGSGPRADTPSDDPDTDLVGDPTQDVVGNMPILDAQKTVALAVDGGVPGEVDPGDILRYAIVIGNSGAVAATGVRLTDTVPAGTRYVADSVRLNGLPVGQPDGGVSPLSAGIDVVSADLTPPLPARGAGAVSAGRSATVSFDVVVDAGLAPGTVISNQGRVESNELPPEPTDADGNDENGDQPTDVVVGNDQQLGITKEVVVVGGGVARAGGRLEYVIRVENIGAAPATDVVISDNLDAPVPGQLRYIDGSALLNGSSGGVNFAGSVLTADFAAVYGNLDPGRAATLRFLVEIDASIPEGATIDNTAWVSWDAGAESASDGATIDVGGAPGVANLHGRAWHDADLDDRAGAAERPLAGWSVEVYLNGRLLDTVTTDGDGRYRVMGLPPGSASGNEYALNFLAPGAGPASAALGRTDSPFTDGPQRITGITVGAGSNTLDLNLPIDPNGVVYDAVLRTPVAGGRLSLLAAATGRPVSAGCFDDPRQQGQVTLADGYYKFDINFSQADCAAGAEYLIQTDAPGAGYYDGPSVIIPPASAAAAALDVPACAGGAQDAIPITAGICEIQGSEFAPGTSVPVRSAGTVYYLKLRLANGNPPGSAQAFNNHIPLDPFLDGAVAISKTSALLNVTRGQLVPYTITLSNLLAAPLQDLTLVDNPPAGFKYVRDSARLDGDAAEPVVEGRRLTWPNLSLNTGATRTLKLLLVAGAGVGEGKYVNRAQAFNGLTGGAASGAASATVRIVPDPAFDCADIIGKVFDDRNLNGYQDEGEPGIAGARVATPRGLLVTTDAHGRFHITCAAVPSAERGSNLALKLDERTLPSGYRLTTENPRVQRATRGKMLKFNFGAAIHRVVRLDVADAVFEPGATVMRPQWMPRLDLLLEQLPAAPAVLRLSYLAENEDPDLVGDRLAALKEEIGARWRRLDCCYALTIETEVFWRRGAPPDRGVFER